MVLFFVHLLSAKMHLNILLNTSCTIVFLNSKIFWYLIISFRTVRGTVVENSEGENVKAGGGSHGLR